MHVWLHTTCFSEREAAVTCNSHFIVKNDIPRVNEQIIIVAAGVFFNKALSYEVLSQHQPRNSAVSVLQAKDMFSSHNVYV